MLELEDVRDRSLVMLALDTGERREILYIDNILHMGFNTISILHIN